MSALFSAWNRFWFAPGPSGALGMCRLLFFGMLSIWMLPHDFSPWGGYSPVFWMPIWLFDAAAAASADGGWPDADADRLENRPSF